MRYLAILLIALTSCSKGGPETTCDELFCETFTRINGVKNGQAIIKHRQDGWIHLKRTYFCADIKIKDTLYCYVDTAFSQEGKRMGINYYMNNELVNIKILDSFYLYKEPEQKAVY